MTTVGHQHAAAPVEPAIPVLVIHKDVLGTLPNDGGHPAHGKGLELTTTLNVLKGIWVRHLCANGAELRGDVRDGLWGGVEFFAHGVDAFDERIASMAVRLKHGYAQTGCCGYFCDSPF